MNTNTEDGLPDIFTPGQNVRGYGKRPVAIAALNSHFGPEDFYVT